MAWQYWTLGSFPELQHLAAEHRRDLLHRVSGKSFYANVVGQSLVLGVVGAAVVVTGNWFRTAGLQLTAMGLAFSLFAANWYQLCLIRTRAKLRVELIDYSRGERVPVCLTCGYDTRGHGRDRCPECNAPLRVRPPTDVEEKPRTRGHPMRRLGRAIRKLRWRRRSGERTR